MSLDYSVNVKTKKNEKFAKQTNISLQVPLETTSIILESHLKTT